jgi:two-component system sensor histidine kinase QseC
MSGLDPGVARVGRSEEELRADCLRLLAHDLNNPLTAIRILAEMLRDEVSDAEQRQDIIDILEAADLAGALMDGLSSLVRFEGSDDEYTWFPIDLVEVLRLSVDRPALRRHVKLEVPREIQMGGDRAALQRAFTDILVNARRLVDGSKPILVTAKENQQEVVIRVHHPGQGIPAPMRERLFQTFGAVELRQNRIPVAAAGLVVAHRVVSAHGGDLAFEDVDGGMDLVAHLSR